MSPLETRPRRSACLIITEHSPESYSPAGERARHMALASSRFYRTTIVLTSGKATGRPVGIFGEKVLLRKTGFVRSIPYPLSALFDPVKLLAFFINGLLLSMKYRPSIIVASMPPLETGGGGWLLGILLRKRLIIDYMDDWESSMKEQLTRYVPSVVMMPAFEFARSIYKTCDGILAATPTLVRRLYQRRVDKQTILVPNGADTEIFSPKDETSRKKIKLNYSLPLSKMVVAYCGSTNTYYRLDLLLISIKSLPNHVKEKMFFVFYLYGDIDRFRRLKNHLGIPDEVLEIRGALPRKALSEVLAGCDVGLVPFDDMPFLLYAMSTKLFEYLSAGVYVVSSGPKGGELDSFFSKNTNCGVFVEPAATDYADTFLEIAESGEDLFDGDNRELRHLFIEENFDSRKIMLYAMDRLSNLEGASKCRA